MTPELKIADLLKNDFDSSIRVRGKDYFLEGRVRHAKDGESSAHFKVDGSNQYETKIQYDKILENFRLDCTCPYFEDNFNCKHLWASILEIDRLNILPRLMGEFKGTRNVAAQNVLDTEVHSQPRWQEILEQVQRKIDRDLTYKTGKAVKNPAQDRNASPRVGVYAINIPSSIDRNQIQLHLYVQMRLKKGALGALKVAELSQNKIQFYEAPEEREFLWDLIGRTEFITTFYSGASSTSKVNSLTLTLGHADAILRKISDAGKLYQLKGENARYYGFYDSPNLHPIQYERELWSFQINLKKSETGYLLFGELVSDQGQTRSVDKVTGHLEHFAFFEGSIARSDLSEHKTWYELVKSRPLPLVENELESFLDYFWNQSNSKISIELPPEIQMIEKLGIQPFPQISFEPSKNRGSFAARLAFNYEGEIVEPNSGRQIYQISKREKIIRDLDFEKKCLQLVKEMSLIESEDLSIHAYFTSGEFLGAVEKTLALGWKVFAKDQRVHQGSNYQINITSGTDWFDVNADIKFDQKLLRLPQLLQALKTGERMITLDDGSLGILPEEWLNKLAPFVGLAKATDEGLRLSKVQALFLTASLDENIKFTSDLKFKSLKNIISDLKDLNPDEASPNLQGHLRDYQKIGLSWLLTIAKHEIGGVLADDMGLGKTIQVLALLANKKSKLPNLVLAPKSLIFNWQNEAAKFTPHLKVLVYAGGSRQTLLKQIPKYDIILSTYQTLRNDIEDFQNIKFQYLILDEAHNLKNSQSQITMAAKLISAEKKFALTGTPVENSLMDLFSILSVVTPGLVTEAQAQRWVKEADPDTIQRLARALAPFILRRTKDQVLKDLPEKSEQVLYCELSVNERLKYDELKSFYWTQLSGKIEEKGLAKSKIEVLEALLRLRQAACHQGLLNKNYKEGTSTKFDLVTEQLDNVIKDGHKALIFSQFTTLLGLFAKELEKRGIEFEYLDGKTFNREERVSNFQTNKKCQVFLLSLKAGGVGLNLTAADYVFILDPWWNPAAESQAIDRTHRIGQTKKVFAYKIIAKDTVEEKILALQEKKKNLAKAIISGDASLLKNLNVEDLKDLFI